MAVGCAITYRIVADDVIARRLRPAMIELLQERFDSEVELATLQVQVFPTLAIKGEGLTLRHRGRRDIPPLITVRSFTLESSVAELWKRHIDRVRLEGLEITIPPRRSEDMPSLSSNDSDRSKPDVEIHELLSEGSLLTIMPKRAGKRARVFELRRIRFENFQFTDPTPFEAALSNPTPQGEIAAMGSFGPWRHDEPSLTPIAGSFVFDADLGTIKGIDGDMHAEGQFRGPLERIETSGRTRTKKFRLSSGGATFPLDVDYVAIVDGTDGDTYLKKVEGDLGRSHITAHGAIVHREGVKGRRITLETTTTGGRLEDFIALTTRVKSSPMTGDVNVKARLDIPPGEPEVIDRMDLGGTFVVSHAQFTSDAVQARVDELSRRGVGRPKDETIDNVASNLSGSFRLKNGHMSIPRLSFTVQGAEVRLAGGYNLHSERLDFRGTLRLQARASKTQTGWKSFVLKIFDPLLDGPGAGTILPITISGTKDQPKFAADLKKALLKD